MWKREKAGRYERETRRDHGFDNIRGLLIICVVFAHLLEIRMPFSNGSDIYRVIYSFHMPMFLFLSGWFAKFDRAKLIFGLFIPYLLLQVAYIFFQRWLYGTVVTMQFATPYWVLWFLLALFFYHLMIPLYNVQTPWIRLAALLGAFALSLIAGYDPSVGYGMTLSRFLVFQPWFMLGFYLRRGEDKKMHWVIRIGIVAALSLCVVLLCRSEITNNTLYGSYPYATLQYHAGIRLFLGLMALLWILFFLYVIKPLVNVHISLLTELGKHTLPVFLLHGFAVKYIGFRHPQWLESPIAFIGIVAAIVLLLGNPVVGTAFRWLFPDQWIKKWRHIKKKETQQVTTGSE